MDSIVVNDLEKTFPGDVKAVRGVSFRVGQGEIFGFLGPNGAGKTTTISMLTTVLRPTGGSATVAGLDVISHPREVRHKIGLVFQSSTANGDLTGRENMELQAGLYEMPLSECRGRIDDLLAKMDLTEAADRPVKGYSGGMKRRLELAVAMVPTPAILFLDEPTLGLDPQGRAGFWRYIQRVHREQAVTIFMTTHYLDEAENLCDRVAIIDHGSIIASGTTNELKQRVGGDVVEVAVTDGATDLTPNLSAVRDVSRVTREGSDYRVSAPHGALIVAPLVKACEQAGVAIRSISIRQPSLDAVFLLLTGRAYREEGYDEARARASSIFSERPQGGDR